MRFPDLWTRSRGCYAGDGGPGGGELGQKLHGPVWAVRLGSRRWFSGSVAQVRRSPGVAAGGLGADGLLAGVGYPEEKMVVRAFLPERMFVTGASPMTLTRASRRESRQNPGEGASMPVRVLGVLDWH